MAKNSRQMTDETKEKIRHKANLRSEAKKRYGNVKLEYNEDYDAYVPKYIEDEDEWKEPRKTVSSNQLNIITEVEDRIRDALARQGDFFFPYYDSTLHQNNVHGVHGGTYLSDVLRFFQYKYQSMDSDELLEHARYLNSKKIQSRLSELLDWGDFHYAEEVYFKTTEVTKLLNNGTLSTEDAMSLHDMWGE